MSLKRVEKTIGSLVAAGHVDGIDGERALKQWKSFINDRFVHEKMNSFVPFCDRIDSFFFPAMQEKESLSAILEVTKKIVVLSHGNAVVERGFSVNKAILQPNLLADSVVASHHAYDGIKQAGGP